MTTLTPYRSPVRDGRDGFGQLLHAEWTKFRTVRGWIIGMILAIAVSAGIGTFVAAGIAAGPVRPSGRREARAGAVPSVLRWWGRAANR
jgi:hypothetical protein